MPKTTTNAIAEDYEPVLVCRITAQTRATTRTVPKRAFRFLKFLKSPMVVAAFVALLAFFIGGALAGRIENHAAEDRLSVGKATEVCIRASCAGRVALATLLYRD